MSLERWTKNNLSTYLASSILPFFTNQCGVSLHSKMANAAGRTTAIPKISLHNLQGRNAVIVKTRGVADVTPILWKGPIMRLTDA